MSARDELFGGMWNGLSDADANHRIDAYKAEVLRETADLFESACPDGPGPVHFELCQCTAASEMRLMADAVKAHERRTTPDSTRARP